MNVFIRADASYMIGTGHIMRCLTVANHLKRKGFKPVFISRNLPGDLCGYIEEKGFVAHCITGEFSSNEGYNWEEDARETLSIIKDYDSKAYLIVDHYSLDSRWEKVISPLVDRIMVIDDLANRSHECNLLLDQNLYKDMDTRYNGLVPNSCKLFLGPKYALLREEFVDARRTLRNRNGQVKRMLVFFGGSDPTNETYKVLRSIEKMELKDIVIDVVVGKSNAQKENIKNICNQYGNMNYHCQVENMAELMAGADLAIGAGGSTTWERCYLGLPSITIIIAENQAKTTRAVATTGAILNLGYSDNVTNNEIEDALKKLLNNPSLLREMSKKAFNIVGDPNSINTLLNNFIGG